MIGRVHVTLLPTVASWGIICAWRVEIVVHMIELLVAKSQLSQKLFLILSDCELIFAHLLDLFI